MVNSVRCLDQFFAAVHPHPNQGSSRQPLPTPSLLEMSAKQKQFNDFSWDRTTENSSLWEATISSL